MRSNMTATTTTARKARRFEGDVVSNSMEQTCVVVVNGWRQHPKYGKAFRVRSRFKVHDPKNIARVGDRVRFEECRPISKDKRWRLIEKL
ncbi:MAG: 30S ribosomal protein S17 [Candidatus Uhrbacteria bacterium]